MPSLNNLTVDSISYQSKWELIFNQPSSSITLTVLNGAIYVQFAPVFPGQDYARGGAYAYQADERQVLPGVSTFDPTDFGGNQIAAVRFRVATNTQPANVSVAG